MNQPDPQFFLTLELLTCIQKIRLDYLYILYYKINKQAKKPLLLILGDQSLKWFGSYQTVHYVDALLWINRYQQEYFYGFYCVGWWCGW
jgi:hypothetical protein